MEKVKVTSNYVYETMERINNIKEFMLTNQKDLDLLTVEQTIKWSAMFRIILEMQNNKDILFYITDDLRKLKNCVEVKDE